MAVVGLGVLGALHAILLFPYDILVSYALLGALLWRVRHWPDPSLLRLAGASVAVAAVCLALLASVGASVEAEAAAEEEFAAANAEAAVQAYLGPFGEGLEHRLRHDLPAAAATVALFNGPLAFAAFCAGLVAGRRGLLQEPRRLAAALRPRLPLLCAGALAGNVAPALSPWLPLPVSTLAYSLLAVGGPCLAALYVLLLARAWEDERGRRALGWLEPAGRMSLTNYLGQSLVASALFMGWGFGLYGELERPALLLVAFLIAGGLAALSRVWLRRFRIGPCEWLLRSWAMLRPQRLRRARP